MGAEQRPIYGGQAVLEGVMIRGLRSASVAVRRDDGEICLRSFPINPIFNGPLRRVPLVRGVMVLAETIGLGIRALMYSANVNLESQGEEVGKGAMAGTLAVSMLFAVGLFFLVPVFASRGLEDAIGSDLISNLVEGLIRLGLLLGYLALIGRAEDIRRVFMYHGAEHMTVHAHEHGDPLEVRDIRRYSPAHPRCGTAFLLVVVLVSVIVFVFTGREPLWWLVVSRVVLVPVIAGASYEVIRFSGLHAGNPLVKLLTGPSLALQSLTTRQPTDDQIEVAITAMKQAIAADAQDAPSDAHGSQR